MMAAPLWAALLLAAAASLSGAGAASAGAGDALGQAGFLNNVNVARILQAERLITGSVLAVNVTCRAHLEAKTLTARELVARRLETVDLVTPALHSPTGTIVVDGDLLLTHAPRLQLGADSQPAVKAASFLAENVVVGGVRQWKLVRHESFGEGRADGWSLAETSACAGSPSDRFLGGHCRLGAGETRKTFSSLPTHSQVRLTARYHFIDNWQGETAFLKLDERYAWADRHHAPASNAGIEVCGNAKYPESRISAPIDVTLPHSASLLEVAFGSTGASSQDPCERSFGVDDVMLYVR